MCASFASYCTLYSPRSPSDQSVVHDLVPRQEPDEEEDEEEDEGDGKKMMTTEKTTVTRNRGPVSSRYRNHRCAAPNAIRRRARHRTQSPIRKRNPLRLTEINATT